MNWQEVVAHPGLQNLPFKIELNQWGQIVMSPAKLKHSGYQGRLSFLLQTMRTDGIVLTECAVWTRKGTKAADVAWFSDELWEKMEDEPEATTAPQLCVEIVSNSNAKAEMREKRKLYFEQGAQEVWICSDQGRIDFYGPQGKLKDSRLFPGFPAHILLTNRRRQQ
jgi:Uma2 family endonuclease